MVRWAVEDGPGGGGDGMTAPAEPSGSGEPDASRAADERPLGPVPAIAAVALDPLDWHAEASRTRTASDAAAAGAVTAAPPPCRDRGRSRPRRPTCSPTAGRARATGCPP